MTSLSCKLAERRFSTKISTAHAATWRIESRSSSLFADRTPTATLRASASVLRPSPAAGAKNRPRRHRRRQGADDSDEVAQGGRLRPRDLAFFFVAHGRNCPSGANLRAAPAVPFAAPTPPSRKPNRRPRYACALRFPASEPTANIRRLFEAERLVHRPNQGSGPSVAPTIALAPRIRPPDWN